MSGADLVAMASIQRVALPDLIAFAFCVWKGQSRFPTNIVCAYASCKGLETFRAGGYENQLDVTQRCIGRQVQ